MKKKYIDTVSTKSSLESVINNAIELSKHPLSETQVNTIVENFHN